MRVAILISGHLRDYETCYYNLKVNLLDHLVGHNVDEFFHASDTIN